MLQTTSIAVLVICSNDRSSDQSVIILECEGRSCIICRAKPSMTIIRTSLSYFLRIPNSKYH